MGRDKVTFVLYVARLGSFRNPNKHVVDHKALIILYIRKRDHRTPIFI